MPDSLFSKNNGILQTNLTWKDVEPELQRYFKSGAKFGDGKSVINLSYGTGFLSRIALVEPKWVNISDSDESLPEKFIVKIPSLLNELEYMDQLNGITNESEQKCMEKWESQEVRCKERHNVECEFYRFLNITNLQNSYFPKVYSLKKFDGENPSKGCIIMEYIESDEFYLFDNLNLGEIKQVLKGLAQYSALGELMDEQTERNFDWKPRSEITAPKITDLAKSQVIEKLRNFENGYISDLIGKYEQIYMKELTQESLRQMDFIAERFGMPRTLIHGDLWTSNLLWRNLDDGSRRLQAIVDFQFAHFSCVSIDIAKLVLSTMSGKDRRQHYSEIVETYYQYFIESLKSIGKEPRYSLDQLKKACDFSIPYWSMIYAPDISPMAEIILSIKKCDSENAKLRVRDKVRCMIEDVIEYFEN